MPRLLDMGIEKYLLASTLLLLAGARILRPAVVLAVMLAGFVLAVVGARAFVPGLPLWIAAAWAMSLSMLGFLVVPMLFVHLPTPAMAGAMVHERRTASRSRMGSFTSLGCRRPSQRQTTLRNTITPGINGPTCGLGKFQPVTGSQKHL